MTPAEALRAALVEQKQRDELRILLRVCAQGKGRLTCARALGHEGGHIGVDHKHVKVW